MASDQQPTVSCSGLHMRQKVNILAPGGPTGHCWATGSQDLQGFHGEIFWAMKAISKGTAWIYNFERTHFQTW